MIYDGAGGECTPMFESYHPLYVTKQGPPQKYYIGDVRDYHDFYSWDGKFYNTLKERVEKAIPENKRRTSWRLFIKSAVIITAYFYGLYAYVYYNTIWTALLLSLAASQVCLKNYNLIRKS